MGSVTGKGQADMPLITFSEATVNSTQLADYRVR
jgi:hypothetical protein